MWVFFSGFCNVWVIYDVCVFDDFVMCGCVMCNVLP